MSAELEEARAIGQLVKQGWRPKRTLIYIAWDGEEQALLGSTEWVEDHDKDLREHAVAYVNSDGNGRGFFNASGSHSLEQLVNSVAKEVEDPETKMSVWQRLQARTIARGSGTSGTTLEAAPISGSPRWDRDRTIRVPAAQRRAVA